jgi:Carboxypeptidase regulatory-like domain
MFRVFTYIACVLLLSLPTSAQTAALRGQVFDPSGAVVPKAIVTLTGPSGQVNTAETSSNGTYSFAPLPPGHYTVRASAPSLEQDPVDVNLKPGAQTLRLELKVAVNQQQTTVQADAGISVSTESANNASAMVLSGKTLQSLADDPEDLATDLQALAGPSAGPGGSEIFIDGFSGGQLPSNRMRKKGGCQLPDKA